MFASASLDNQLSEGGYGLVAECDLPKVETRVRFSLPALLRNPVTHGVASSYTKTTENTVEMQALIELKNKCAIL